MNKSELVAKISEKSELSKVNSEKALEAFVDAVVDALASGDKVQLVGFGTFEVGHRNARVGHNPQNPKEDIQIPASDYPKFKAGSKFKGAIK